MHRVRHLLHPTLPLTSGARASALALLAASLLGAAGVALQDKGQATPKADKNTRLKVVDGDRKLDVRLKGEVQLDAAAKEPVTVPGEGSFRIEEKKGGSIRAYAATKDQRTYTVDGKDRPLDAEGEAWLREVVKEAAQAQASSPKARKLTVRTHVDGDKHTHDIEVHAKALEAHARELEAHAKALEAQDLSPSERARIQAEMDRARADLAKAKADLKKEIRVQVVEGRGPATVIVTEGGNGKAQVEKRVKILRKDGKESTWTVIGPDREHVIIDESGQEIRIPPIHIPKIHVRPFAPPPREDAQEEMAEIKAALKALQTRLEQLQKQMGPASAGPRNPKPPAKPKPFPPPPPSPPLPPPPPLPAPGSPDAPPPPPPPPPPPAPDAPPEPPAPPPPPRL